MPRRILIDAGRKATAAAIKKYVKDHRLGPNAFELFVITHIDRDHIEGAVPLLRSQDFRKLVQEVWFNGRRDLEWHTPNGEFESMGALDGERITATLQDSGLAWNSSFGDRPVAVVGSHLPNFKLTDGLTLTLLSPDLDQLAALAKPWDETVEEAPQGWEDYGSTEPIALPQLAATQFKADRAKPNGSSIGFAVEFEGRRVLLGADAHVARLLKSLVLYSGDDPARQPFTLVKAPHHGSRGNVSQELVAAVSCENWAFSTNGDQFRHPDAEAVARVVEARPACRLFFNYSTDFTEFWTRPTKPTRHVQAIFGDAGYLAIDIDELARNPLYGSRGPT
jgi:hypothetical protein